MSELKRNGLMGALRDVYRLAKPFFIARDDTVLNVPFLGAFRLQQRVIAWLSVFLIMGVSLAQVAINVRLSFVSRDIYNSLQAKDASAFWTTITTQWLFWVAVLIASFMISIVLQGRFRMRWRNWATERALGLWLTSRAHYRSQFLPDRVDNPDQRIADDIRKFTDQTLTLAVGLLKQVTTLVSFSVILWTISSEFNIPGTETKVPGLLLWIAILYAIIGTWIAHVIGRKLITLNYEQEKVEANFRFNLIRIREFSESIALIAGENAELQRLKALFAKLVKNFLAIIGVSKFLSGFQAGYGSLSSLVPFIVGAPYFFAGRIDLGTLTQTADAFGSVQGALSFFVDSYSQIADYKASVDRLTSFEDTMANANALAAKAIQPEQGTSNALEIGPLTLDRPNGEPMVDMPMIDLEPGKATLLMGPSGSGKSTLLRAIAGLWPFAKGHIALPKGRLMVLPQRSYMPEGTLRAAMCYPDEPGTHDTAALEKVLRMVELPALIADLDQEDIWTQRLSGGEQQRLAIARAILAKPAWLLLDEATSALDEALEARIMQGVKTSLPGLSLISIGHRASLKASHEKLIELVANGGGVFIPVVSRLKAV